MEDDIKLMFDTTFTTDGIWEAVSNEIIDDIRTILMLSFESGEKWYEMIDGYDQLPWKVKHHLDIRMEMIKDLKR
jgi:hypothetical protein